MKLRVWAFACLAFLAACAHAPARAPTTTAEIGIAVPAGASDWFIGHYTERVLLFHNTYTEPMDGGVAFVGDSITEGGDWAAVFPGVETRNYGIGGDTTVGLDNRFAQIVAARPGKVFLAGGAMVVVEIVGADEINEGLRRITAARGIPYVDIYTPFAVDGGILDPVVTNDQLHLNGAGYARWRALIDHLVRGG